VQLVSQDMNDQQIANRLCLHIGTVKSKLKRAS
jgi:DNA-binding CsgD family transcriptional regulator